MILSHTHLVKPPGSLEEHKILVKTYLEKMINEKEINLDKIIDSFKIKDKKFVRNLLFEAILLHDEGKKSCFSVS